MFLTIVDSWLKFAILGLSNDFCWMVLRFESIYDDLYFLRIYNKNLITMSPIREEMSPDKSPTFSVPRNNMCSQKWASPGNSTGSERYPKDKTIQ